MRDVKLGKGILSSHWFEGLLQALLTETALWRGTDLLSNDQFILRISVYNSGVCVFDIATYKCSRFVLRTLTMKCGRSLFYIVKYRYTMFVIDTCTLRCDRFLLDVFM